MSDERFAKFLGDAKAHAYDLPLPANDHPSEVPSAGKAG
jgi:hypothetical protein